VFLQLFAHKKGVGSSKNGRDSNPQYLGVKRFDGQIVTTGTIILRQRGPKVPPGTTRAGPPPPALPRFPLNDG